MDYYEKKNKKHEDTLFYSGTLFIGILIVVVGWNLIWRLFS